MSRHFNPLRAMTEEVIKDVIRRFARTARLGEQADFTGVEIHAAHGYLLSQFLSPLRALIVQQVSNACRVRQYQRWIAPRVDAWSPPVPRQRNAP